MVNIPEGRRGRMPIFFDVIERLSICNIITKQVKLLIFWFDEGCCIINALNCNVLYFVQ